MHEEEQGKKLVKVDRFFASSQTCSVCGYKNAKSCVKRVGLSAVRDPSWTEM